MGEGDVAINLLERLIQHSQTTAKYNVYYGEGRDAYDISGRVVHESIFNTNDGNFRCPSTQQGYSPSRHGREDWLGLLLATQNNLSFLIH